MQDKMSATAVDLGAANGTSPPTPESTTADTPPLPINQRSPKGKSLPDYAVEYFNQLVAQYLTLPGVDVNPRNVAANELAKYLVREQQKQEEEGWRFRLPWERKKHDLNWADVSGMEMAVLQLLPEAYLQRYAWNLRARYHEVAGQCWYDFYQHSTPPEAKAPSKQGNTAAVTVTQIPLGTSSFILLTPTVPEPAPGDASHDSPAAVALRADLSILLSDLQRLRSTTMAREEKHSRISLVGALLAAAALTLALVFYGGPSLYGEWIAKTTVPGRAATAVMPVPTATVPPRNSGTLTAHKHAPGVGAARPVAGSAKPAVGTFAVAPTPSSSPLRILQMSALVILGGVLGGLISMLRRLQALPPGTTPLFDTIALNAGQFGIGLAPIYGGIFAMVLYLVFLSGILDTVIASTAGNTVFPRFTDATPKSTPDYAKLLVWAFIAGFAEQMVPDVLNRLTTRNTAALAKSSGASGTAPPSGPA